MNEKNINASRLIWSVVVVIVSIATSLYANQRVFEHRVSSLESDMKEVEVSIDITDKEIAERLRNIELKLTELSTLLTYNLKGTFLPDKEN